MFDQLLPFVPERERPVAAAILGALIALQILASQIIAQLPANARQSPRWGWLVKVLYWLSHARFRDEPGTVKLPGRGSLPPTEERAALLVRVAELDRVLAGVRPVPNPIDPEVKP